MNEATKSVIRHILTAVGTFTLVLGLNKWTPIIDYISNSFDGIWDGIIAIIGFITTLIGFFTNKDRFEILTKSKLLKK